MKRAFSGYYPNDVCGVVYQNAHRHLARQFTFARDGIPDVIREPDAWERAKQTAKDMLGAPSGLSEIGNATLSSRLLGAPAVGAHDAHQLPSFYGIRLSPASAKKVFAAVLSYIPCRFPGPRQTHGA